MEITLPMYFELSQAMAISWLLNAVRKKDSPTGWWTTVKPDPTNLSMDDHTGLDRLSSTICDQPVEESTCRTYV